MDLDTKMSLLKGVGEEIITEQELRLLLETKDDPIAYDGFEPSGLAHVPFGIYRAINLEDLLRTGIKFKLWIADWFAWINNKMGGDLSKIRRVGEYFIEVWKAAGVDMTKVEVLWASDAMSLQSYWKKVMLVAKKTTLKRAIRCLTIMGRTRAELREAAQIFYPIMQCADIFHLKADICQLGLDQRRANMLAREVGPKLGWWKPVIVSHHMLMGLQGVKQPEGYDEDVGFDLQISSKMSKSRPETCIYVHDSEAIIREKILTAFCPGKQVEGNPLLEYSKHIIFKKLKTFEMERPSKYGGDLEFYSYKELETYYREGRIHPLDLKNATAQALNKIIKPIREHFEKDKQGRRLYNFVKEEKVTR